MKRLGSFVALGTALLAVVGSGCSSEAKGDPRAVPADLSQHVLGSVPADVQERVRFDFEGKLELVGLEIEPRGEVRRGESVALRLFWRSLAPLGAGWNLSTQALDSKGTPVPEARASEGGLRRRDGADQVLGPSHWQPGKVYVDEQRLEIPKDIESSTISIVVSVEKKTGYWRARAQNPLEEAGAVDPNPQHAGDDTNFETAEAVHRLRLISGESAGQERAKLVTLTTGWHATDAERAPGDERPTPAK